MNDEENMDLELKQQDPEPFLPFIPIIAHLFKRRRRRRTHGKSKDILLFFLAKILIGRESISLRNFVSKSLNFIWV